MAGESLRTDPKKQRSNRLVAGVCLAFFGGMVGMAYAAVPTIGVPPKPVTLQNRS